MKILVPVRYPLTDVNVRAIQRGLDLVGGFDNPELLIFHMNELQTDQRIRRDSLREAVEAEFGDLEASYVVRDGFIVEEAIIGEAIRLDMEYIILSQYRRDRWTHLLGNILSLHRSLEDVIREKTGIQIEVVTDTGPDSSLP